MCGQGFNLYITLSLSLSLSHSESARLHVQHDREADLRRRPQGMFPLSPLLSLSLSLSPSSSTHVMTQHDFLLLSPYFTHYSSSFFPLYLSLWFTSTSSIFPLPLLSPLSFLLAYLNTKYYHFFSSFLVLQGPALASASHVSSLL